MAVKTNQLASTWMTCQDNPQHTKCIVTRYCHSAVVRDPKLSHAGVREQTKGSEEHDCLTSFSPARIFNLQVTRQPDSILLCKEGLYCLLKPFVAFN